MHENQALNAKTLELETDNKNLLLRYEKAVQDLDTCQREKVCLTSAKDEIELVANQACQYRKDIHPHLSYLRRTNDSLMQELSNTKGEILALKASQQRRSDEFEEELKETKNQIAALKACNKDLEQLEVKSRTIISKLADAQQEHQSQEQEIEKLRKALQDKQGEIEKLRKALEDKEGELRDLAANQIENIDDVGTGSESGNVPSPNQLDDQSELKASDMELADTKKQLQDQQQKVERLQKALEEKTGELRDLAANNNDATQTFGQNIARPPQDQPTDPAVLEAENTNSSGLQWQSQASQQGSTILQQEVAKLLETLDKTGGLRDLAPSSIEDPGDMNPEPCNAPPHERLRDQSEVLKSALAQPEAEKTSVQQQTGFFGGVDISGLGIPMEITGPSSSDMSEIIFNLENDPTWQASVDAALRDLDLIE